jgi:hypothetical protein
MSEFRRRLITAVSQNESEIPAGCVRCEYLESYLDANNDNGQYIDTEKVVSNTDIIELMFALQPGNNTKTIFGWRWQGDYSTGYHCYINTNPTYIQIGYGNNANNSKVNYTIRNINVIQFNPNTKTVLFNGTVDSASRNVTLPYNNGTSVYNPFLFTADNIGAPNSGSNCRIYEYSVKDKDGNYIQHLVPILDKNGKPCMYDTVTKKYHYNKRTNRTEDFRYELL